MSVIETPIANRQELRELTWEAERFLYREADLLDARLYEDWLDTLHEDLVYFMPILRNARHNELEQREATREGIDISWFEEGKWTMGKRIEQIRTGAHWAEEPVSRVVHFVSNVYVTSVDEANGEREIGVSSRILVRQNRNQYENIVLAARRNDVLRNSGGAWSLLRREIKLAENVLSAKMLTTIL
ncbi:3-phenylpropionate/cinnamic acid dioxygenase subunit beta [Pusillimonas noertemannii]|uniref:3-phenylpropionate/cinnamic acid dioxygenase small subunit n=1 Tax=Pusillimonas noertemannii TaxID=305977 RepID=A0A2U1CL08_9BURK|nr:3-phenylpropionate/cinnamic acid dioxygenase subunit beta [Pusillimonas noertemannii]PVY61681.1 3-phenylpropionate/cinnamic acid dioxygenase small subunit [Pusillimonas noertemannii]